MEKENKISQAQIARDLGVSSAYLCQILTGAYPLSYKLAYKWSKSLGKPMDWWLNASPGQIKKYLFNSFNETEENN